VISRWLLAPKVQLRWVVYATVGAMTSVMAAESGPWTYKFTPSFYATDHDRNAFDLNLRANNGPHTLWIGQY